mmetsp:Transcript_29046/g.52175  ORF Transcript_29046/g.52175 Transcript_29046/m.52175 type:complete len:217 (-) Transcript_29046:128-778(-)
MAQVRDLHAEGHVEVGHVGAEDAAHGLALVGEDFGRRLAGTEEAGAVAGAGQPQDEPCVEVRLAVLQRGDGPQVVGHAQLLHDGHHGGGDQRLEVSEGRIQDLRPLLHLGRGAGLDGQHPLEPVVQLQDLLLRGELGQRRGGRGRARHRAEEVPHRRDRAQRGAGAIPLGLEQGHERGDRRRVGAGVGLLRHVRQHPPEDLVHLLVHQVRHILLRH